MTPACLGKGLLEGARALNGRSTIACAGSIPDSKFQINDSKLEINDFKFQDQSGCFRLAWYMASSRSWVWPS
jgi:hypothetical protein